MSDPYAETDEWPTPSLPARPSFDRADNTARLALEVASLKREKADLQAAAGTGVALIAAERQRQIVEEGYTPEHDELHPVEDFVQTAAAYLGQRHDAPWVVKRAAPDSGYYQRRDLVRAGALIAAAIDRLDQIEAQR